MREDLVQAFPNNRIILLPQTAHFSNEVAMKKSASIFSQHKDLHLFSRDTNTFEMMKAHFSPNVALSPDMAHQLYGAITHFISYVKILKRAILSRKFKRHYLI